MKFKNIIFIIVVSIITLLPSSTLALDLELSSEDKILDVCAPNGYCNNDNAEIWLSYDNNGKVDGHLLLLNSGIVKYDLNGKQVYFKKVDEFNDFYDLIEFNTILSSDNDNVKGESDILITFYNSNREVVLEKLYGGNGYENVMDGYIIPSFDNEGKLDGWIFPIGSTSTDLDGVKPGYIYVKIDLKGNVIWQHNDTKYNDVVYNDDGSINSYFTNDGTNISRVTLDGELLWKKTDFGLNISYLISPSDSSGFVLVGYCLRSHSAYGCIKKFDLDGNLIFEDINYYSGQYYKVLNYKNEKNIYVGYIVIGTAYPQPILLIYDFDGNNTLSITNDNNSSFFDIVENYDENGKFNGYVVLGYLDNDLIISKYTYPSFEIVKENDDVNTGTIKVDSSAFPGEVVKISVTPKDGYFVKKIIVKDEAGKEIEVSNDGTFVMPEGKVTVSAIYERITNPDTVSACYMILGIILVISIGTLIITKQKKEEI